MKLYVKIDSLQCSQRRISNFSELFILFEWVLVILVFAQQRTRIRIHGLIETFSFEPWAFSVEVILKVNVWCRTVSCQISCFHSLLFQLETNIGQKRVSQRCFYMKICYNFYVVKFNTSIYIEAIFYISYSIQKLTKYKKDSRQKSSQREVTLVLRILPSVL